jgi:hypothetical protein
MESSTIVQLIKPLQFDLYFPIWNLSVAKRLNKNFLNFRAAGPRRAPEPVLHARVAWRARVRRFRDECDRTARRVGLSSLPGH